MNKSDRGMLRLVAGSMLLFAAGCEPERQGVPPEPLVEDTEDPGTSGGAPRSGRDTGPETPAL